MDFYCKFTDETAANAVLYTTHAEVLDMDGNVVSEAYTTPNYINIDVLGILYQKQEILEDAPIPLDGWHVNIRTMPNEHSAPLNAFEVSPAPSVWRRVWA
jgi:alkyl hydroperoxide reductase subunit AhpF